MSYAADASTIRQLFEANWPVQQPSVNQFFGDVDLDPPDTSAYVRLTVVPGDQIQVTMGTTRRFRRVGIASVEIRVPAGSGDGEAQELGDSVAVVLQGKTVSGVILRGTSLQRVGPEGAWMVYNASTPYQADSLI